MYQSILVKPARVYLIVCNTMAPMRGSAVTATKLTMDALHRHLASGSGDLFSHGFEYDNQDDGVSEANADCGAGSSHSLSSVGSKYVDIPHFGCPGDFDHFVCRGTLDRAIGAFDDDAEDIIAHMKPDTQQDPLVGNRVAAVRLALANFDKCFADDRAFRFDSTVQHRNTAKLPEVLSVFTLFEKRDEQIDIEKMGAVDVQEPATGTRGKGLAPIVATMVLLGGVVALLAIDIGPSAAVKCGVSLFLAILLLAFTMTR